MKEKVTAVEDWYVILSVKNGAFYTDHDGRAYIFASRKEANHCLKNEMIKDCPNSRVIRLQALWEDVNELMMEKLKQ